MNIKMLKAALAGLVLSVSGFANAGLIPFGVQNDVDITTVKDVWGWNECWSGSTTINSSDTLMSILDSCDNSGDSFMMASWGANGQYDILAAISFSDLYSAAYSWGWDDFGNSPDPANKDFSTTLNGAKWYLSDNWSTGFAGAGENVTQWSCDYTSNSSSSICLHTSAGNISNIYRGGPTVSFLVTQSTSVPEPSTLAIFALGLMGLASRRFKKQS